MRLKHVVLVEKSLMMKKEGPMLNQQQKGEGKRVN